MIEYQLPPPPPLTEEQRERLKARMVELERQDKKRAVQPSAQIGKNIGSNGA